MEHIKDLPIYIIQYIRQTLYIAPKNNAVYGHNKLSNKCKVYIDTLLKNNSNYISQKQIYKAIMHAYDLSYCKICSKQLLITKRKNTYCSIKCKYKDTQYLEKVQNTLYQKYGVCHNLDIPGVRQKAIENSITKEANVKRKQTNLIKYGYQVCSKNEKVKQKMKQTNMKKYGNQFGVKNIEETIEKSRNKMHQISWINFSKFQKFVKPNFSFAEYNGIGKEYEWKCILCGNIFKQTLKITKHISQFYSCPRCYNCFPLKTHGKVSGAQKQISYFCKQYFNVKQNDRQLINPYQLDIVIPQIKLAIQFNGLYWHNIEIMNTNKHLKKTNLCEEKGYRLLHIWQDDWNNNKEEIKNKLILIFKNEEIIDTNNLLDRCWYSQLQFQKYEILPVEIVKHGNYLIENCGYLKIC